MPNAALALVLFGGFFLALLGCLEAGRRVGRRTFAGDPALQPAGLGAVEAVAFGLLGLLLAFTFSGAAARLDVRRAQIVDEANAIGTAWLRLDLLPATAQPKLRQLFRGYADSRIAIYRAFSQSGRDAFAVELARSTALQNAIWTESLVCGFLVGYEMGGSETPSWPHILVLALVLSFTLYVILDFEYPRLGLIRIDDFDRLLVQARAAMR